MIVHGSELYGRRISDVAGAPYNPEVDTNIARVDGNNLLGGVTYTGYTGPGGSIHMHTAGFSPNWANRDFLWLIFHYPFEQLKVKKVFGQVPETNTKALEIDLRLGFKIVAKIEDVFPDGACYLLSLGREDCRWLKLTPRRISEA